MLKEKKKQEDELAALRKEVVALQIMNANYTQIVKAHQNQPQQPNVQLSDESKFQVFEMLLDTLYLSFEDRVMMNNFAELSGSVFTWLEQHCKPQSLREIMMTVLQRLNHQMINGV